MLAVALWLVGWLLLVALGGLVLFLLGRSVYRKARQLFGELAVASERLSLVSDQLQELQRRSEQASEPAVFESPSRLRQQRHLRRTGRAGRTMTRRPTA